MYGIVDRLLDLLHLPFWCGSLGGAIATWTSESIVNDRALPGVVLRGLAVLDVVEGSALNSLPFMAQVLRRTPMAFESVEQAISWCV